MTEDKENRNKRIGLAVSLGIHALLALLFVFIMAWRAPNPPHPEYGVVLNFGLDEAGSGDVQPETQPTEEAEEAEEVEEITETVQEELESEVVEEEITEPVEEIEESAVTTDTESPVEVPEVEEEEVEPPREETKEPVKKPTEKQPEEKKQEERKVESAYPAKDANATQSQGDKTGTGDQGDPEGELDERALYGNPGGGGGSSFDLEGWNWDWIPKPEDTSNENGRLVFEIRVNADGEILSVRTLERSVSPAVEKVYRAEVEKLTFSRKSSSGTAPPVSTGTITFVIKSK